jgi:hypothetical protein
MTLLRRLTDQAQHVEHHAACKEGTLWFDTALFLYIKWEGVEGFVRNVLRSPYFYVFQKYVSKYATFCDFCHFFNLWNAMQHAKRGLFGLSSDFFLYKMRGSGRVGEKLSALSLFLCV